MSNISYIFSNKQFKSNHNCPQFELAKALRKHPKFRRNKGSGFVLFCFVSFCLVLYCIVWGVFRTVLRVFRTVYCVFRTVLKNEDNLFKNIRKALTGNSSQVSRYSLIILRIHAFLNA